MTQEFVANYLQIERASYTNYELGKRDPDTATLSKLSNLFDVSSDYLLGIDNNPRTKIKTHWIPILGDVPAGIPIEEIEYNYGYVEIPEDMAKVGELFALYVKGDSMEPDIKNGDVAVVLYKCVAESGNIVVARVNSNEVTIKRLKIIDKGIILYPNNPEYEPMFFTNDQVQHLPVTIIGQVVEIRRKIGYI